MKIKPLYLLNIALTAVLLTSILANATVNRSGTAANGGYEYDPWVDTNDDGIIDIFDLVAIAQIFGEEGTPINKTELLLELQDRVDSLNASLLNLEAYFNTKMMTLNASLVEIQSKVNGLETKIAEMNATIIEQETIINIINATHLGKPDYDSKWTNIPVGGEVIFTHNLNTTDVLVYMVGLYSNSSTHYIHQIAYGGEQTSYTAWGAMWYDLTATTITVLRQGQDNTGNGRWNQVRIIMWKIPES